LGWMARLRGATRKTVKRGLYIMLKYMND
jgi:hypothetical protein